MEIYLIRHGKTAGNGEGRYIGATDEPLCSAGIEELNTRWQAGLPEAEIVYTSDLIRTRQTAVLLFPDAEKRVRTGLRETDFGAFEGKNYQELNGRADYQAWIDAAAEAAPPGGESREAFTERTREAFEAAVKELYSEKTGRAAFVVHGGSIMAILSSYGDPAGSFYDWQAKNGCGFLVHLDEAAWQAGAKKLTNIRSIP